MNLGGCTMNKKQFFIDFINKIKDLWIHGKIQRTSRITYDIAWNILLFFIVIGTMFVIFAGGVGAGYFASLVKDESLRDYEEMRKQIYNYEETSKLYFADEKYIGDIRADLHREEVELENVSEHLVNAVIATEDELFYEHNGIVPKAIVRALFQEVTNADVKTGGSTLTQQLIKNQILTNEVSFERKAKEILLAMRLEKFFEKDEILEAYLNVIPYGREASGRNIAGIQTAAQGIFGVDASELNLPQAAYLAGLPKNPYVYTPFEASGKVKDEEGLEPGLNRMKTVLKRMHEENFIDEKEYEEALAYDITKDFTEKSVSPIDEYPAIVFELEKRAKAILMEILAEEDGYSQDELLENEELQEQYEILADRALRMNGYHIHSTIDKEMYDKMQEVVKNYQYFGPDRTFIPAGQSEEVTEQVETGVVLIENSTGRILSFVPGRDYQAGDNEFNFATQARRSPGSTIKPLVVYAPGMELGMIQPGSVVADIPISGGYTPKNYSGAYYGLVSAREALAYSYNVSTVEFYKQILGQNPAGQFLTKMGIPLSEEEQQNPSLALGGMEHGVTVEQNTAAFATFSNGGEYVEQYMIEKIVDSNGNVIYEHEPEPETVFSPQTAYLTIDMMRDVLRSGTATFVPSRLKYGGVDWAGKTGTSDDYHDAWFVGTNPNVTMSVWLGYKTPSSIYCASCSLSYSQRAQNLWVQLINVATDVNPELLAPKERHQRPDGIVSRTYCATSGLLASKICSEAGLARSDIYNAKFVPTETDDSLVGGNMPLVEVDGEMIIAGPNTPPEFTVEQTGGFAFNPEFLERMGYDRLSDLSVLIPRKNAEAWSKIALHGGTSISGAELEDNGQTPPAPTSLSVSGSNITWSGAKGHYIVGYRIYHASEEGGSFKLIGHTIRPSYAIPSSEGVYHIRAVNYFGRESEPSKQFVVESENRNDSKEENDQEKERQEKEQQEKDKSNNDQNVERKKKVEEEKPRERENRQEDKDEEPDEDEEKVDEDDN